MGVTNGIIAAGHADTAEAGARILREGGNAFDAAAAAALTSFVAEPSLTSLGGGGFCTAVPAGKSPVLYDFFVQTPTVRHPVKEMDFVESYIDFGTTRQIQYIGRGSAAVPGCPAGVLQIHAEWGRLPLSVVAAPAIELARKGVVVTPYQEFTISILNDVWKQSAGTRNIFFPDGELVTIGDRMVRADLADTLEALAREGAELFYAGEIGQRYARDNAENGGSVSWEDLRAYQVIKREPVRYPYRGYELITNPPPSAGGSMISYGLALLAGKDKLPPPQGPKYVALLTQVMREMEIMRADHLQPRLREGYDGKDILAESFLKKARRKINWLGNTTHISVIDAAGNAVGITTTLGGASGHTIPGTGVLTNNMLGELDLHPGGFYVWEPNSRVTSMMSPTVLTQNGRPKLVTGSGGSSRIRSAILQTLVNVVDHGMTVAAAVDHARLHYETGILNLEPGLLKNVDSFSLPEVELVPWQEKSMFFGGAHTVGFDPDGTLAGKADQRRDGKVVWV